MYHLNIKRLYQIVLVTCLPAIALYVQAAPLIGPAPIPDQFRSFAAGAGSDSFVLEPGTFIFVPPGIPDYLSPPPSSTDLSVVTPVIVGGSLELTYGSAPGSATVTVSVLEAGIPLSYSFIVTLTNDTPASVPMPDQIETEVDTDSALLLDTAGAFTDLDQGLPGESHTITVTGNSNPGLILWNNVDTGWDGLIGFTQLANQNGTADITIQVTDAIGATATNTITVVVNAMNDAPVLGAIGDQTVNEATPLTFTASATDIDTPPDTLTYSLDGGAPAGAAIDPLTGVFGWTPVEADGPGTYSVTVRVTDDGTPTLDDSETITITVDEVNVAPVLGAIGDQTVDEGTPLTFTAGATDTDLPANGLTYSLDAGAPAGATLDPLTGAFSWTPVEGDGPGTYPVTVRVTDDGAPNLDAAETITITVNEVNVAPVLGAIGDQSVNEETPLTFAAGASQRPDLQPGCGRTRGRVRQSIDRCVQLDAGGGRWSRDVLGDHTGNRRRCTESGCDGDDHHHGQ